MRTLEVFFDYACPYCWRGHEYLMELLPQFSDIEIVWRPCEAHPRPDRYGLHSDLCIQGMFYAKEQDVDILEYHARIYSAMFQKRVNVEDVDVLAKQVEGLLDPTAFADAVKSGIYESKVQKTNHYAYGKSGIWVVPAYHMQGRKLHVKEDVGVSKKGLLEFLSGQS